MTSLKFRALVKKLKKQLSLSEKLDLASELVGGGRETCEETKQYIIYTDIMWDDKIKDYREVTEEDFYDNKIPF